jgi:hypothetical protein
MLSDLLISMVVSAATRGQYWRISILSPIRLNHFVAGLLSSHIDTEYRNDRSDNGSEEGSRKLIEILSSLLLLSHDSPTAAQRRAGLTHGANIIISFRSAAIPHSMPPFSKRHSNAADFVWLGWR